MTLWIYLTNFIIQKHLSLHRLCDLQVRQVNMYREGDVTPYGQILEDCSVRQCWEECLVSAQYYERKSEAELYNR